MTEMIACARVFEQKTQLFPLDVFIAEIADFTDTETRRIHECDHCLGLDS